MYGVLVDVSRSMQSVYSVDDSRDTTVRRSHAIFKTVLNIVNNESNNQDEIFVGAFGVKVRSVTTCDLLALLNKANKVPQELQGLKPGVEAMVKLANREGYGGTVDWIRKNLSEDDAKDLFRLMCIKPSIKKQLLEKLPSNTRATAARYAFKFQKYAASVVQSTTDYDEREREVVRKSDAFQCAKELVKRKSIIMEEMLLEIQTPIPQHTSAVVELFQEMKLDEDDPRSGSSESVRKKIDETLESIEPYIYGATPMVKAMRDTLRIFRKFKRDNPGKQMALLILTDGESTDGNPKIIADQLKKLGVTIVTCFLTNEHLDNPYKCYDDSEKSSPLCPVLLEMSSTKHNNDSPMYYLADAGWKLPLSGESRLYIEANTLEIVNEVCEKVISELNRPCRDGVTDILTAVGVQNLVGQSLDKFKPGDQDEKKTCYAHAVAAVICFALHRIVDRDGGYPEFETVCEELIHEFGEQGAHVSQVLSEVCPRHRLRYTDVNEIKARAALSRRRPLVATFKYTMKQREQLIEFYEYNSCGILHKENLEGKLNNFTLQFYKIFFLSQLMIHLQSLVMR